MQDSATNGGIRVTPFKRMAYVLSGLAYNRHVGPVALAVVIGLVTGLAAIGFRELVRFLNFILLERAWAWAEATPPYGRAALPVITGGGGLVVGLLVHYLAPEAKGSGIPDVIGAAKRWECGPTVASPDRSTALIL